MNKFNFSLSVLAVIVTAMTLSCVQDPLEDKERQERKIYEDSVMQSDQDNDLILQYLQDKGYTEAQFETSDLGVRYLVIEEGEGTKFPEINDIISIDYIGRFLNDSIFDTNIEELAIYYDSLRFQNKGVNLKALMVALDYSLEDALVHLNTTNDALNFPLYFSNSNFESIHFNHTSDGVGISGFISGFRTGIHNLVPGMSIGSRALILIPSAVGYGVAGSDSGRIPGNTPIVFEIILQDIRP